MKLNFSPPTYFFMLLLASFAANYFFSIKKVVPSPYNYIGLALILFGVVINIWSDRLFKHHKTTVKPFQMPSALITTGPYKISRHPMYVGMASILFGLSIFMGSLMSFLLPIIFVFLMELMFISVEEENLKKIFGKKYTDYKNKTHRWL